MKGVDSSVETVIVDLPEISHVVAQCAMHVCASQNCMVVAVLLPVHVTVFMTRRAINLP